MSHEVKIHDVQTSILRELLFRPNAGYAELQKESNLTSDHFNFHIKRLVELGLVRKLDDKSYSLTTKGKEYANKLDTDSNTIERQPKISVILIVTREKNGNTEHLFQQRLKQPYYGYWGRLGGKVRWGESITEAAQRELLEETDLKAAFEFKMVYHKRDYTKADDHLLEDKVFLIMTTHNPQGQMNESFEGGRNAWMTADDFLKTEKHFDSAYEFIELLAEGTVFTERSFYYDEKEY